MPYFDTEMDKRVSSCVINENFYYKNFRERIHKMNNFVDSHDVNLNMSTRVTAVTDDFIMGIIRSDSGRTVQIFKTTDQELQVIYDRC